MAEINSIDRLQFRHHSEAVSGTSYENPIPHDENGVFTGDTLEEARARAIAYISGTTNGQLVKYSMWAQAADGCDNPYGHSLYGEPTVVKYRSADDENDVHLLLAIGMTTNNSEYPDKNLFCIIDIDKTEQEIADLWEEIERLIKMLTITVIDTDTLDLNVEMTDNGTFLSGDVKTPTRHIFETNGEQTDPKKSNLMVSPSDDPNNQEGLFIYVNLEETDNGFKFVTSQYDGTLKETNINLSNDYVVSGVYKVDDESIHLRRKEGGEVVIDCKELIYEWDVATSGSTPIVLKRERVKYSPLPHHKHSDILSADIMIDESRPYNILKRNTINSAVYVDGHAKNIAYDWNGENMTVNDALNNLNNIRISPDRSNILQDRADGFFANTTLDFISSENQLIFRTTNVDGTIKEKVLQLNTVEVPIDEIYYDPRTENLIIKWRNDKGEIQTIKIPIGDMIDEWEVLNPGHNVTLVKARSVGGNDKLSADANIYDGDNNILVDRDHSLYVKGTADNIKYKNITVEEALDNLDDKIEDEKNRAIEAEEALQDAIEAVSADSRVSLKHVVNEDKSIDVVERDGNDGKEAVINVNLSDEDGNNTIRLKSDGLYNFVDLTYDEIQNKLTLIKSTSSSDIPTTKDIQLAISFIEDISYDPVSEKLIITYRSGTEIKTVEIDLKSLIEEWDVENTSTVTLTKERVTSGGPDTLTADVNICHHEDNAIERHNDGLYVHDFSGEIEDLGTRIDIVSGDVNTEKVRAVSAETYLQNQIGTEKNDRIEADREINDKITAFSADTTVKLNNLETNLTAKIDTVSGNIMTNLTLSADTLADEIERERVRALSAETALNTRINEEKTRAENAEEALNTTLTTKISNTATILSAYTQTSVNDEKTRAMTAEGELRSAIVSETERANAADQVLSGAIVTERERAILIESQLSDKIDAATVTFDDTKTVGLNKSSDNIVKANVKIALSDGNLIINPEDTAYDGLFASARLDYDVATNKIKLITSAGEQEFQLSAGAIIDNIYYDDYTGDLVITYTNAEGTQTVRFSVSQLFNEWIVQNPSTNSAIKLTKTRATASGAPDELSAQALITDDFNGDGKPDEGSDNLIQIRNNGLYVCGSAFTNVECVSAKTDAIYKTLYDRAAPGGCGENIIYEPYRDACIISAATSFYDADRLLDNELCHLLSFWVSGMTCTSLSYWLDEGLNRALQVDVRASRGNTGVMTDEDIYISNLTGKTIEHGVNEFTDTNVLRMVCLTEGGGGIIPSVESLANGMYLSNVWDCGKYYDLNDPDDVAEKEEVEADGYNADYFADDINATDYNNNVRQNDI